MSDEDLKNQEWMSINNILLELYRLEDLSELSGRIFNCFRLLISFAKGYFLVLDDNQKIDEDKSSFFGFEPGEKKEYVTKFYDIDYLSCFYDFSRETSVIKDSEMVSEQVRENSEVFKKFFKPAGIPFGTAVLVAQNQKVKVIFSLFRGVEEGDFSSRDIFILNVLKKHLEEVVLRALRLLRSSMVLEKRNSDAARDFGFSKREREILKLIADGKSNREIGELLNLSPYTVKKHVYNIFNKAGVNSRTQLLRLVYM